ncbi:MopE-related protein [Thermodesulfobacteriota bacterium]
MKKIFCILCVSVALLFCSSAVFAGGGDPPPPTCTDADGDGYSIEGGDCGLVDCDDGNSANYPYAAEVCGDGIDNNCSGAADEGCSPSYEWSDITPGITGNALNDVWVSPSGNPVAVGDNGIVVRSDDGGANFYTQSSGVSNNLTAVYGFSDSSIYTVSNWHRETLYYNGSSWNKFYEMYGATQDYGLKDIWGPSESYMVSVGDNNQKWLFYTFNYNVYTYSGQGSADAHDTQVAANLYGVSGTSANDWYAVGNNDGNYNLYHFTGSYSLSKINTGTTTRLNGVWVSPAGDVFAVGENGVVVQNVGYGWEVITGITGEKLRAVWGTASDNVFAVGNNGTILHYDGSDWAAMSSPVTVNLKGIYGVDEETAFIVGGSGTILKIGSACEPVCTPGANQSCVNSDGTSGTQACAPNGCGWGDCDVTYSVICEGNLCWQDPQREAYNYNDVGINPKESIKYCEDLVLGGFDDWRLPTMNELRSLIDGNPDTAAGGACPVDDDATKMDGWYMTCIGGPMFEGPGVNGCYLKDGFTGTCDKLDIYSADHHLETWAITEASDDERWIGSVLFEIGGVAFNHICSLGDVRCVRDAGGTPATCDEAAACVPGATRSCTAATGNPGAQVCNATGDCWGLCESTLYVDDPAITPECDNGMCASADKLQLTIDIPAGETLPAEPHMLIAFFYDSASWQWPPIGPPDGGTWTNQVIEPGMPPYYMEVPGCSYYGEYLLEGDYQLLSILQQNQKFPPIPVCGDYIYGEGQAPITHPLGADTPMSITLEPMCESCPAGTELCETSSECVADISDEALCCPVERSYRCSEGTGREGECVATPAECDEVLTCNDACDPCPDDSMVWGCRFSTSFAADSCADMAVKDGFVTEQDAIDGANGGGSATSTPVCTLGYSCRYERALQSSVTRCTFSDNGRPLYAYGVPSIGCTFGGGSGFISSGPICGEY